MQHGPGKQADDHEMQGRDEAAIEGMGRLGMTFTPGKEGVPTWANYGVRQADGTTRYYH